MVVLPVVSESPTKVPLPLEPSGNIHCNSGVSVILASFIALQVRVNVSPANELPFVPIETTTAVVCES